MKKTIYLLALLCCNSLFAQNYFEGFNSKFPEDWIGEGVEINNKFFDEGTGSLEFAKNGAYAISPIVRASQTLSFRAAAIPGAESLADPALSCTLVVDIVSTEDGSSKELSIERAKVIQNYLVENGVNINRLDIKGFGGSKPIYDIKNADISYKNMRVEIRIIHFDKMECASNKKIKNK